MKKTDFFKTFKNQSYIEQLKKIPNKFNAVHNQETSTTEITIYGVIGDSWWEDSVSASQIDEALKSAGDNDIVINLNSPGGDAFDGISIYNRLDRHKGKVTVYVDGWACSAASIIAMAADELKMGTGSMMMIHEASTVVWGKKSDLSKEIELLSKLDDSIVDIYMTKAAAEREDIKQKLENETWFTAKEAIEMGFANSIEEPPSSSDNTTTATASAVRINDDQMNQIINQITNNLKNNQSNEPLTPAANPAASQKRKGFIF